MKTSLKAATGFVFLMALGTGWWTVLADNSAQSPGYPNTIPGVTTNLPPGATDKPLPGMTTNLPPGATTAPAKGAPQGGPP